MNGVAQNIIISQERSMPSLKFRYLLHALEGIEGKILEVGCGDGKHVRSLEAKNAAVRFYGCDTSLNASF